MPLPAASLPLQILTGYRLEICLLYSYRLSSRGGRQRDSVEHGHGGRHGEETAGRNSMNIGGYIMEGAIGEPWYSIWT